MFSFSSASGFCTSYSAPFLKGDKKRDDDDDEASCQDAPSPGLGAPIELSDGDAGRLLDFLGIGKTLPGERITAEEAPPALLLTRANRLPWG